MVSTKLFDARGVGLSRRSRIAPAARPAEGSGVGNTRIGCVQSVGGDNMDKPIAICHRHDCHSSRNTKKPPEDRSGGLLLCPHMGRGHYRPPRRWLDLAETAWHLAGGDGPLRRQVYRPAAERHDGVRATVGCHGTASVDHEVVIAAFDGSFAKDRADIVPGAAGYGRHASRSRRRCCWNRQWQRHPRPSAKGRC